MVLDKNFNFKGYRLNSTGRHVLRKRRETERHEYLLKRKTRVKRLAINKRFSKQFLLPATSVQVTVVANYRAGETRRQIFVLEEGRKHVVARSYSILPDRIRTSEVGSTTKEDNERVLGTPLLS